MRNSNSWTYKDKQVTELPGSKQQQTHSFFDIDEEDEDQTYGLEATHIDSFQPKHNPNRGNLSNTSFMDHVGSAQVAGQRVGTSYEADLVSEIDRKVKEHVDNVLHAVGGMSARLTQLESRIRKVENTVDDVKESIEYNHGRTDGKLRELENILREVQGGVKDLRDKQQIAEAQLQLEKLKASKVDPQLGKQANSAQTNSTQEASSFVPQQSHQSLTNPVAYPQQPAAVPSNIPQNPHYQNPVPIPAATAPQLPTQMPQNIIPSIPQHESYGSSPMFTPETTNQHYHMPSTQQLQPPPPAMYQSNQPTPAETTHQQYHMTSTQQSQPPPPALYQPNQPTPPETTHQQYHMTSTQQSQPPHQSYQSKPQLPQLQSPSSSMYFQGHSPLSHQSEEAPYLPSQSIQKTPQPPGGFPPTQQVYGGSTQPVHDQHPSRPYTEFPSGYLQQQEHSNSNNLYPYGASPYGSSSSNMKQFRPSPPSSVSGGGSRSSQLPTVKILPHALPTASSVDTGSACGGSAKKIPIDDVVDKVVAMGFRRDLVRATVRKLTENGQSVDLNVVLDKVMNEA